MSVAPTGLTDFERIDTTLLGRTYPVFTKGEGPGVVVIPEIPGLTPEVAGFARRVADLGCTVVVPSLFGTPGRPMTARYATDSIVRACVSKEFVVMATNRSSPVTEWLRALAADVHTRCGGPGVGAIGMCLTGGFALAMMVEPAVVAPVLSQPSLPFPVTRRHRADLGLSPADREAVVARAADGCDVLALRFSKDMMSPGGRFRALEDLLGERFIGVEIDSGRHNTHGVSRWSHSVVTRHLVDEPGHPTRDALDRVLEFFRDRLLGGHL